jgi:hypothetical protein
MSKPMSKPLIYGLFIVKFLFGLTLIIWTVMMTLSSDAGEDDDNAFLTTYHKVDDNFNNMVISNTNFENKYNLKFYLNNKIIDGLTLKDVFLGQRIIKERKIRKNILKLGENIFKYELFAKDGTKIKNVELSMMVTMTTNHTFDKKLNFKQKIETFNISKKGYWNITGTINVGNDKGYFFIKTNTKL